MLMSRAFFQPKKSLLAGISGCGKTFACKAISKLFDRVLVYTPHREEWVETGALVITTPDFIGEFPFWCRMATDMAKKNLIDLFIVDEADLLFKSHFDVSLGLKEIIINHRHYGKAGLTLLFVTKRPQNLPTQVYGEFEILMLFSIDSPQVIDLLNKYIEGLGDMVAKLPYRSYQFVLKHIGQPIKVMKI